MTTQLETLPLVINGEPTTALKSNKFSVYSLEQQKDVYLAESADVDAAKRAADASLKAFKLWKKTNGVERRKLLLRYAQVLRSHEAELVTAQRTETGMSEMWAKKNVELSANLIEEIAACITRLQGEIPQTQTSGGLALALTVPIGPVLAIAPWVKAPRLHENSQLTLHQQVELTCDPCRQSNCNACSGRLHRGIEGF